MIQPLLLPRSKVTIAFDARNKPSIESPLQRESCNRCSESDCYCQDTNKALDVLESFLLALVVEFSRRRMFSTHREQLEEMLDEAVMTTLDAIANHTD